MRGAATVLVVMLVSCFSVVARAQGGAKAATEDTQSIIRLELASEVDNFPDVACVISEIARPDVLAQPPAAPAASSPAVKSSEVVDASSPGCSAPEGARDTSLPLACLRVPGTSPTKPDQWRFAPDDVTHFAPLFVNRPDVELAVRAMAEATSEDGDCSARPAACSASFASKPYHDVTFYQPKGGTSHIKQELHISCFQQQRGALRLQDRRVAVILLEFGAPRKAAVATGKLVGNVLTLPLTEGVSERAGISVTVLGGHYAATPATYVIDGLASLTLEPRCSRHPVDLGRVTGSGAEMHVVAEDERTILCSGVVANGHLSLWLSREEELNPGKRYVAQFDGDVVVQTFELRWDRLSPRVTLPAVLRVVSFTWHHGCFVPPDECPSVMIDDVVRCDPVAGAEGDAALGPGSACAYVCDAWAQNASIELPAKLSFGLSGEVGGRSEGTPRFRWHQVLPAAGAQLIETIGEPEGRSITVDFDWDFLSTSYLGINVDRIILDFKSHQVIIDEPKDGSMRLAVPQVGCGEQFEVLYSGSRAIEPWVSSVEGGRISVPDPAIRRSPVDLVVGLHFGRSFSSFERTQRFEEGAGGAFKVSVPFFPWSDDEGQLSPGFLTVGYTLALAGRPTQVRENGVEEEETVPWVLAGFDIGIGYEMGLLTAAIEQGVGFTVLSYPDTNSFDATYFTTYSSLRVGWRFIREVELSMAVGVNWRDPERPIDLDADEVGVEHLVRPFVWVGPSFHLF